MQIAREVLSKIFFSKEKEEGKQSACSLVSLRKSQWERKVKNRWSVASEVLAGEATKRSSNQEGLKN